MILLYISYYTIVVDYCNGVGDSDIIPVELATRSALLDNFQAIEVIIEPGLATVGWQNSRVSIIIIKKLLYTILV